MCVGEGGSRAELCALRCVSVHVCVGGADGCIPLNMLADVCQCCCLLMFICLPLFEILVRLGE